MLCPKMLLKNTQKVKQNAFYLDKTRQFANFQGNPRLQSHKQYRFEKQTVLEMLLLRRQYYDQIFNG